MADGKSRPISQVKPGDKVADASPAVTDGTKDQAHAVIGTQETFTDRTYVDVTVASPEGPRMIVGTAHHLYWDATSRSWTPASQLRVGHKLQTGNGATVSVVALRPYTAEMVTYNLAVDNLHTYFVLAGATPILVHNCVGGVTVYRGVSRISGQTGEHNPAYDDAVNGIARPRGGTNTPEMHHLGYTDSDFTSWSTSEAAATRAALKEGSDGIVLKGTIPADRFHVHSNSEPWMEDDWRTEFEVIIQGEMLGEPKFVE